MTALLYSWSICLKYFIKKRDVNQTTRYFEIISQKKLVVIIIVLSRDLRLGLRRVTWRLSDEKNRANVRGGSRWQQHVIYTSRIYERLCSRKKSPNGSFRNLERHEGTQVSKICNKHQFHNYLAARIIAKRQILNRKTFFKISLLFNFLNVMFKKKINQTTIAYVCTFQ